jgi:hypothetical protein
VCVSARSFFIYLKRAERAQSSFLELKQRRETLKRSEACRERNEVVEQWIKKAKERCEQRMIKSKRSKEQHKKSRKKIRRARDRCQGT